MEISENVRKLIKGLQRTSDVVTDYTERIEDKRRSRRLHRTKEQVALYRYHSNYYLEEVCDHITLFYC
jgi:hypothetical protein